MTISRPLEATLTTLAHAASILAIAASLATAATAAEPNGGASGRSAAVSGGEGSSRRLDLSLGRSVIIDLPRDAKEVFVGNPAVANAVVRSTRKIFLIGVAAGVTSVFVMDAEGRQITTLDVTVGAQDLSVLQRTLRATMPSARVDAKVTGNSILLSGTVTSAGDARQAQDIAEAFIGVSAITGAAPNAGAASVAIGKVINALTITGRDQVMLKVSVVEMARTAVKQLGVNVAGNWNIINDTLGLAPTVSQVSGLQQIVSGAIGALGAGGANVEGRANFGSGAAIGGTLQALERAGVSRILAEPTLVAVSGESASFLAGGEIPIIINTCGSAASGCTPTVTYKQYGIALSFTPIVLSEGKINLRVSTEVSEIDRENQDAVTRSPGFRTRKTSTSVEVPSGGTMVTAGLISSQSSQTISGVPGLINLPVLGALFRSRDFQRRDTELMIMVTPYIAKPMEAAQVRRPDDGFVDSSDPQAILLGQLNKLYGVAGPAPAGRYGGRVGFITD